MGESVEFFTTWTMGGPWFCGAVWNWIMSPTLSLFLVMVAWGSGSLNEAGKRVGWTPMLPGLRPFLVKRPSSHGASLSSARVGVVTVCAVIRLLKLSLVLYLTRVAMCRCFSGISVILMYIPSVCLVDVRNPKPRVLSRYRMYPIWVSLLGSWSEFDGLLLMDWGWGFESAWILRGGSGCDSVDCGWFWVGFSPGSWSFCSSSVVVEEWEVSLVGAPLGWVLSSWLARSAIFLKG